MIKFDDNGPNLEFPEKDITLLKLVKYSILTCIILFFEFLKVHNNNQ